MTLEGSNQGLSQSHLKRCLWVSGERLDGTDSEAAAQKLRGRVGTTVTVKLRSVRFLSLATNLSNFGGMDNHLTLDS